MPSECPTCSACNICATSSTSQITSSPYSVGNLYPIGTFALLLQPDAPINSFCDHVHEEDSWHLLSPRILQCLRSPVNSLCEHLDFLIQKRFIVVTYQSNEEELRVRVYLIPYDLPNIKGSLRKRPTNILAPARRYLKSLLPLLQSEGQCSTSSQGSSANFLSQLQTVPSTLTLSQIYSELPSPDPRPIPGAPQILLKLLERDFDIESELGLRSRLYFYQRRTVAQLIQRETNNAPIPDPLYIPVHSSNGRLFYFQPGTYEVLRERPMVVSTPGGILCEELGTGKTIMTLSLILATRYELSVPEDALTDVRPVLTPIALRHFPSAPFDLARQRCINGARRLADIQNSVPSLVELLIHRSRTHPQPPDVYEDALESSGLQKLLNITVPFYHHYLGDPTMFDRARRDQSRSAPRTIYLTSATLVVVPSTLIGQWYREIHKHCEIALRVLQMRTNSSFPPVKSLATDYDIILMTYERFTAEKKYKDVDELHTFSTCDCQHDNAQARIPHCTCPDLPVSPLLQIRWKRLIIDEGHVSSNLNTLLTPFVKVLSIQSKWIVTGTPTTNLLGLSFGSSSAKEPIMEVDDVVQDRDRGGTSEGSINPTGAAPLKVWNNTDRMDLQKFGAMLIHFIGTQQFLSNPGLYKACVVEALMDADGPRPGALQILMQLMSSCMVRHRISDIEQEATLPPLRTDTVLLDMEPLAATSYNAMQATIVVNAVDSQRTDQDYLFHPKNAKLLQVAVANLSQIMFWGTSDDSYNVDELARTAESQIKRAIERGTNSEDTQMLREAMDHVKKASADSVWHALQKHPEVPFQVNDMPTEIFNAWTDVCTENMELTSREVPKLMHPLHLIRLKQALAARPLASIDWLAGIGREMHESEQSKTIFSRNSPQTAPSALLRKSPFSKTSIGCSSSSKLNFIINEVLQHSPTEKILIFSQSPFSLALVKDALDLLDIPCCQFVGNVNIRLREEQVVTFETSEAYRVFLMELRHGARGLNLISASRVIFCEPVWHADVESQAIKRVHRIGQTKPVHVQTLVIRGSAEEYMVNHRSSLKAQTNKIPKMIEEQGMRYFIMHPKFINTPPVSLPKVTFPLLDFSRMDLDVHPSDTPIETSVPLDSGQPLAPAEPSSHTTTLKTNGPSPVKKRRVAQFAC